MWSKLLEMFRSMPTEDIKAPAVEPIQPEIQPEVQMDAAPSDKFDGRSVLMGYDYLKGMKDEENIDRPRKFINLNKLLRGDYKHEKT